MSDNAILHLRQLRLAQSTRPFLARGCRVIRCKNCLLPTANCICVTIRPQQANSRFCLIMCHAEPLKPSNTGRLIADILPNTQAFFWARTEVDSKLLAAINDPCYQPYVIFPEFTQGANRLTFNKVPQITSKPPLFIIFDSTWAQARKMFRKSPYLDKYPIISLDMACASNYQLRTAQRTEQHCTAEVAITLLQQAGDNIAAHALAEHFSHFRRQYLAGKSNHQLTQITAISKKYT